MGSPEPPTRPARRRRRALFAAAVVGLLTLTAAACRVPSRYDEATIIGGLSSPWDMAFEPGGGFFFTERGGTINLGSVSGQRVVLGRPGDVVAEGEGGMMGIAVDPDFGSNRRIYTCYMTANDVRVVRWVVSGGPNLTLDRGTPIVTGIERSTSGRHSGCRTRFDQFKTLFVTTGDAARGINAQNLDPVRGSILNGKVLRVDTEGRPVEGNIEINGQRSIVYAYGFRNPQGISFRPSDGWPFLIEHGADRDDEITPIHPGANGGWNPIPGYNESVSMTDFNLPNVVAPQWSSGFPTLAPSGGTFVTSALWGDRAGQMAVAVLKGQQLRMINLNPGVIETGGAVIANLGRIRVAVESPFDGRLYVLIDSPNGAIVQITPVI
jgi:glucose/arabinose dehydrogenase